MHPARPRSLISLILLLGSLGSLACVRQATTSPSPDADADARKPGRRGPSLAILAVPQKVLAAEPWEWSFDPSGRFVAALLFEGPDNFGGCGVWDIESGSFIREFEFDGASDPCRDWEGDIYGDPPKTSPDGELRVAVWSGDLEIEAKGAVRSFPCPSCDLGFAWAWAPSGHTLATCNGDLLEIWDADTGKQLRSEVLGFADDVDFSMGWTDDGLVVVVHHPATGSCAELDPEYMECDDADGEVEGYALSSFWWPDLGAPVQARRELHVSLDAIIWTADLGLRWIAFVEDHYYGRDEVSSTLHVIGTTGRTSALGWTRADDWGGWVPEPDGRWRVDAVTQWLESDVRETGGDYSPGLIELGWRAVVVEPGFAVHGDEVAEIEVGWDGWGELEIHGAVGGAAAVEWMACADDHGAVNDSCESSALEFDGCDLFDVSPSLEFALADCEGGLRLLETGGRRAEVAALLDAHDPVWRWGRVDTLAVLDPGVALAGYSLVTGKLLYERKGVEELPVVPLAAQQDRLLLVYNDHAELIVASTGARVLEIPGALVEFEAAALSPDGKRLAVLGDGRGRVLEISTGAPVSRFTTGPDAWGVAWRQDGAALFYGHDWPTHVIDPATGRLLGEIEDHPAYLDLEPGHLDPSWRWIYRRDGSIVRTLDFARLEFGSNWARTDSGVFDGELAAMRTNASALRFRIGDQPDAVPRWTIEELEPWLRKRGLAEAFFAGEPLPVPSIPKADYAKLEAKQAKR